MAAAAIDLVTLYGHESKFFLTGQPDTPMGFEEALINHTAGGSKDAMIALLLHRLPRLETFRIHTRASEYICLTQVLRAMAEGYQDTTVAPQLPLQALKTVVMNYDDTEGCLDIDWACYFLCIPSLQTSAAWAMGSEPGGRGSEDYLRPISTPVSNVEELFFDRCQFDPASFEILLPYVKNLKRFTYASGGATVAYSLYEPRKVIKALSEHAGHSLEELILEAEEEDYTVRSSRLDHTLMLLTACG